jgi:catechol 2,3-dioxygenase-like lactoylglutathione lyase family enzyme
VSIKMSDTTYYVRNLEEAIDFYTGKLGFRLREKFDWGFAYIDIDGQHCIGLMSCDSWKEEFPSEAADLRPRVALETDDFDAEYDRLKKRGVRLSSVAGKPSETRGVMIWDSDENPIFLWGPPRD